MAPVSNLTLPLPAELDEKLRVEAEQSGQPKATLVLEALRNWLDSRQQRRLHEEISAWAREHAGTDWDLDREAV